MSIFFSSLQKEIEAIKKAMIFIIAHLPYRSSLGRYLVGAHPQTVLNVFEKL